MKRNNSHTQVRVPRVVARYQAAWDEWQRAVAGLREADYASPNVSKRWNLKDVLGHLAAYMNLMMRRLRSYKKSRRMISARAPSYSNFNRREAARRKTIPRAEIQAGLESDYRELVQLIGELSDDDLKKHFRSAWTASAYTPALGSMLNEEAGHIRAHANEVKKWREKNRI